MGISMRSVLSPEVAQGATVVSMRTVATGYQMRFPIGVLDVANLLKGALILH